MTGESCIFGEFRVLHARRSHDGRFFLRNGWLLKRFIIWAREPEGPRAREFEGLDRRVAFSTNFVFYTRVVLSRRATFLRGNWGTRPETRSGSTNPSERQSVLYTFFGPRRRSFRATTSPVKSPNKEPHYLSSHPIRATLALPVRRHDAYKHKRLSLA